MKKNSLMLLEILLGIFLLALAIAVFVLPTGIIVGGVTGLSLILNQFTSLDISLSVLLFNVVLFLVGALVLGKKFAVTTVISTFVFPLFISVCQGLPWISQLNENLLLSCIFAGLLQGLGIGIVIRNGASTGGMDIPPLIINKMTGLSVGILIYLFDTAILLAQAAFTKPILILYGILVVLITSFVIDKVVVTGQQQLQLFAVSKEYEKIRQVLLYELDYGITLFQIETGLDQQSQKGILCITSNRRLHALKEKIISLDPQAFITVSSVNEVKGKGFSLAREHRLPK